MKKSIKVLLLFLILNLIVVKNVEAATIEKSIAVSENNEETIKVCKKASECGGTGAYVRSYTGTIDGKQTTLYCKDPGLNLDSKTWNMKIDTLDPNSQHDAGIIYILKNGTDNAEITLAIRFYEYIFGRVSTGPTSIGKYDVDEHDTSNPKRSAAAVNRNVNIAAAINYFKNWGLDISGISGASDPSTNSKYMEIYRGMGYDDLYASNDYTVINNSTTANNVKILLEGALDAARTVGSETEGEDTSVVPIKEGTINDISTDLEYKKEVTYSYFVTGFDPATKDEADGDSILLKFDCPECSTLNVEYEVKINDKVVDNSDLKDGIELLEEFITSKDKTELAITITFTASKSDYDCGKTPEYHLDLAYTGVEAESNYGMFTIEGTEGSEHQVTYGVIEVTEGTDGTGGYIGEGEDTGSGEDGEDKYKHHKTYDEKIEICDEKSCEHLKKVCDGDETDPDLTQDEACDKYEEQECDSDTSKNCSTYLSKVSCSTGSESYEFEIREGVEVSSSDIACVNDASSKVNVDKCVINGEDILGNSYNQNKVGSIDFEDNSFCKVACIENFRIKMPEAPNTNSNAGRYFSIEAKINGGKQCYTGTINLGEEEDPASINKEDKYSGTDLKKVDSFEYKYEVAREIMYEAMNMYSFYTGLQNKTSTTSNLETVTHKAERRCDRWGCYSICDGDSGTPKKITSEFSFINYDYKFSSRNNPYKSTVDRISKYSGSSPSDSKLKYTISCSTSGNKTTCKIESSGYAYVDNHEVEVVAPYSIDSILKDVLKTPTGRPSYITEKLYGTGFDATAIATNASNGKAMVTAMSNEIKTYVQQIKDCSSWEMDEYTIEANMAFDYEEGYIENDSVIKTLTKTSDSTSETEVNNEKQMCDREFEYDETGKVTGCNGNTGMNTKPKTICDISGDNIACNTTEIPTVKSVYQSAIAEATYTTPTQFRTLLPSGVIVAPNESEVDDSIELPNAWPLEFIGQGVYTYKLYVSDLGEYDKNHATYPGKKGRIWDTDNPYDSGDELVPNVVAAAAVANPSCTGDSIHIPDSNNPTNPNNGEYFCAYRVNCSTCNSSCDPKKGICDEDCVGVCKSSCNPAKGVCLFDGKLNVSARPSSPNKINPNDREMGVNWRWDDNIDSYVELKAFVTTQEIEDAGETIFDVDFGGATSDTTSVIGNNYAMQLSLTGNVINWIKQYNNDKVYTDNSLDCYDYINQNTGETYQGIFCYSKFIDELMTTFNDAGEEVVKITNGVRPRTVDERNQFVSSNQNQPWWTTWDESSTVLESKNEWLTSRSIAIDWRTSLNYAANADGSSIGIGPAWK